MDIASLVRPATNPLSRDTPITTPHVWLDNMSDFFVNLANKRVTNLSQIPVNHKASYEAVLTNVIHGIFLPGPHPAISFPMDGYGNFLLSNTSFAELTITWTVPEQYRRGQSDVSVVKSGISLEMLREGAQHALEN